LRHGEISWNPAKGSSIIGGQGGFDLDEVLGGVVGARMHGCTAGAGAMQAASDKGGVGGQGVQDEHPQRLGIVDVGPGHLPDKIRHSNVRAPIRRGPECRWRGKVRSKIQ